MKSLTVDKQQQMIIPPQSPVFFSSLRGLQKEVDDAIQEMEQGELVGYEEIKKILDQYSKPTNINLFRLSSKSSQA